MTAPVTIKLKRLRQRAGYSMDSLAKELGYKGGSSYQRYENQDLFTKSSLPFTMTEKLADILVGRGSPPITSEEVWDLCEYKKAAAWSEQLNNVHQQGEIHRFKLETRRVPKVSEEELLQIYSNELDLDTVMRNNDFIEMPTTSEMSEETYLIDITYSTSTDRISNGDVAAVDLKAPFFDNDVVLVTLDDISVEPMVYRIDKNEAPENSTLHPLKKSGILPPKRPISNAGDIKILGKVVFKISRV